MLAGSKNNVKLGSADAPMDTVSPSVVIAGTGRYTAELTVLPAAVRYAIIFAVTALLEVALAVDGALYIRQNPVPVPVNRIPFTAHPTLEIVVNPVAVPLNVEYEPKSCMLNSPICCLWRVPHIVKCSSICKY